MTHLLLSLALMMITAGPAPTAPEAERGPARPHLAPGTSEPKPARAVVRFPILRQRIVWTIASDGTAARQTPLRIDKGYLGSDQGFESVPLLSRDGRKLAYLWRGGTWLARSDGSGARRIATRLRGRHALCGWSPDSTRLAFAVFTDTPDFEGIVDIGTPQQGDQGFHVHDATSGSTTHLKTLWNFRGWASNSEILYEVSPLHTHRHTLYAQPITGGPSRLIVTLTSLYSLGSLTVGPDQFAFSQVLTNHRSQIVRHRLDGRAIPPVVVSGGFAENQGPAYSPDGTALAYLHRPSQGRQPTSIRVVALATGAERVAHTCQLQERRCSFVWLPGGAMGIEEGAYSVEDDSTLTLILDGTSTRLPGQGTFIRIGR